MKFKNILLALLLFHISLAQATKNEPIIVGCSKFTESYVLGEIAVRTLQKAGFETEFRRGIGAPAISWQALISKAIQILPTYTGTIEEVFLNSKKRMSPSQIRMKLKEYELGMTESLGFCNTYALVMRANEAKKLGIKTIQDLGKHPNLIYGLTHEFVNRPDGWQPLRAYYKLPQGKVKALEHSLGYTALNQGIISVKDAYSTDAKIEKYNLVVLQDNLDFFPKYEAVFLYQLNLPSKAISALGKLAGTIDEPRMQQLNAIAEDTKDYKKAASVYFREIRLEDAVPTTGFKLSKILKWTVRHITLAGTALLLAIFIGLPLGIRASHPGAISELLLGIAGVIQTIPSLALLALLVPIPFLGIGTPTVIVALTLYGLLPIIHNTANGLRDISQPIKDSADALGMSPSFKFFRIYLPIASPTIITGIKTTAVITIGYATLGALIGAGGLGEPIISGLNLNDTATILEGAIPVAILALLTQWGFTCLEHLLVPKGLRLKEAQLLA